MSSLSSHNPEFVSPGNAATASTVVICSAKFTSQFGKIQIFDDSPADFLRFIAKTP